MFVKICYALLFIAVISALLWLSETALKSPWGRMMRAIRDNETAAAAMGKDVTWQHLRVFILGSAVIGLAGAMLTTLDGQFTPVGYNPLRFTFLIWVMVIIGGSGNNWGAVLGGFFIWFFWIEAEPIGLWLIETLTAGMDPQSAIRAHLLGRGCTHALNDGWIDSSSDPPLCTRRAHPGKETALVHRQPITRMTGHPTAEYVRGYLN